MAGEKTRHGCLTAWLILMIAANGLTAIGTPLMTAAIRQAYPDFPSWLVWPLSALSILNVVCAVALFRWKRWAFYGFAVSAAAGFCLNLYGGTGIVRSVIGLAGILVLWAVLQIGGDKKGWTQLE